MAGLCCSVESVAYCMPNGCYIDLGGKKIKEAKQRLQIYISQETPERKGESPCFGRVLACTTELPKWAIRKIKKPGN